LLYKNIQFLEMGFLLELMQNTPIILFRRAQYSASRGYPFPPVACAELDELREPACRLTGIKEGVFVLNHYLKYFLYRTQVHNLIG